MMNLEQILIFCWNKKLITSQQANMINFRNLNNFINGYPLLHLICNNVNDEQSEQCLYFKTAISFIRLGATVDILDKHGKSPLHYAAQEGKYTLLKALIYYHANVNLCSLGVDRCVALEFALRHTPKHKKLINYLHERTHITEKLLGNIREIYEDAILNWERDSSCVHMINRCIELNLASIPRKRNDCLELQSGVWIRTVSNIEREVSILDKRDQLISSELVGCQAEKQELFGSSYTPYSPATFVVANVPVSLFYMNEATGVIIKQLRRSIDYFYDGSHGEQLSRDFNFSSSHGLRHSGRGQLWNCGEQKILQAVHAVNADSLRAYKEADRYGAVIAASHFLPWNEGLFRYQKSDIIGIYVDPIKKESAQKALEFRSLLDIKVPLYSYDYGALLRVSSRSLMRKYRIDSCGRLLS